MSNESDWRGLPGASEDAWDAVFEASRETLFLSAACPLCGATTLRRWYRVIGAVERQSGFRAHGELWRWCATCRTFEHHLCLVPDWWSCDLVVDSSKLTDYPIAIEEAIHEWNK